MILSRIEIPLVAGRGQVDPEWTVNDINGVMPSENGPVLCRFEREFKIGFPCRLPHISDFFQDRLIQSAFQEDGMNRTFPAGFFHAEFIFSACGRR